MMIIANQCRTHAAPVATAADWHDTAYSTTRSRDRTPPSCFIGAAAYRHMQRSVDMDNNLKKTIQKTQAAIQEAHPRARGGGGGRRRAGPGGGGERAGGPGQPGL